MNDLRAEIDVSLPPDKAFEVLVDELSMALGDRGLSLEGRSAGCKVVESGVEVGVVKEWVPGRRVAVAWRPKSWEKGAESEVVITVAARDGKTAVSLELTGWGDVLGGDQGEVLGWFSREAVSPMLSAASTKALGEWLTDRSARRPSGARSGGFYRNPTYHWPNFFAIFDVLSLSPNDRLVEIGCGGGAFLHEALKSGCSASAIDHSPDMVRLSSEVNAESISARKLDISLGDAGRLPFGDGRFTCAVMTGVLFFIPDSLKAFKEVSRVLVSGGRFVLFTGTKELKGTPAAPEPVASRLHFYDDDELVDTALRAGFSRARVDHPSLLEHARKSGVPESDLYLFKGTAASQLLVAVK